ncbi:hypothetical protein ALQ86_103195 [Pseudomonas amygdali pv. eriobotryae]|uniref:Uncharacterized protein n=1 Tax=Pseudomonas amygdali pv. eriobotryae TaxID=129137 RepID=A0A3M3AKY4_PSEA0|nr:hypothetical protein ALQ86_103195 [Pseudomonas amygdali pv. eriobotryae]
MPDNCIGAVAGVDVQSALPGRVLQLQGSRMFENSLAAACHTQFAMLLADLSAEFVITLRPIKALKRDFSHIANPPVRMQRMTEMTRFTVLVACAQTQLHALPQLGMQIDLPVPQLQAPVQADALFALAAVDQFPVQQAPPAVCRPAAFTGVSAVPGPAHWHATPNRPHLRPLCSAPEPGFLALRLKMQQLRALATEDRLTLRMIDNQYIAQLVTLPLESGSGTSGSEEALQWMFRQLRVERGHRQSRP